MAELPINYLDTGKVARDKINNSFEALETTVLSYRPHIENGVWWIGGTNTGVKAVGDSIEMKVEDGYIRYKSSSANWTQIIATSALKGPTGNGIDHLTSSKSGKTTTVVLHYTNGNSDSFTVQDGADGQDVGYIVGPDSATNGNVVLFDGTTGKLVKDSGKKLPTKVSDLSNDSGFITDAVDNLVNYYLKSETYTKAEVNSLISNFGGFEVVTTLPTQDIKTNVIYLKGPIGSGADKYEEYIYSNNNWILIGETSVDLTNYFNTSSQTSDAITEGTTNLFLTASERTKLGNTSGTNTGDQIASDFDIKDLADSTGLRTTWSGKQDELESGTNIKTINNQSLLGSGNITISGGGSDIVYATQAEYNALLPGAESDGKHYFIYTESGGGGWQPGVNTVAYYPLDSTNTVNDLSGNNYNLTNVGSAITFGTNQGVSCASFDGNRDHYLYGAISTLPVGNTARTISVWCYNSRTAPSSGHTDLLLWRGTPNSTKRLRGELADGTHAGAASGKYQVATWGADVTSTQTVLWQEWVNWVITYDQSAIKIYINNNMVANSSVTNLNTGNNTLYIGGGTTWALEYYRDWLGYMSNIIIENVARTAQEVSDYFDLTKGDYGIS